MSNQIIPCPHCGKELMVIPRSVVIGVRSIDGRGRSSSTIWSAVDSAWRSLLPSGDHTRSIARQARPFEHAITPAWGQADPFAHQADPDRDHGLSPGEIHTSKTFRERAKSDLVIPLYANLVSSGMAGAITLAGTLLIKYSDPITRYSWLLRVQKWISGAWWQISLAVPLATMAGLWFWRQLPDLLDDSKLIVNQDEHKRTPDPGPAPVVHPPAVNLEFNERNEHGRVERQVRATLSAPASNHDGLWRYCEALAKDQAFPSLEGGKSGPGAAKFGYSGAEFDAWRKEAQRAGLLEAPRAARQPWTITPRGYGAFARIGQQKQREASYAVG